MRMRSVKLPRQVAGARARLYSGEAALPEPRSGSPGRSWRSGGRPIPLKSRQCSLFQQPLWRQPLDSSRASPVLAGRFLAPMLIAVLWAGQSVAPNAFIYAVGAISGASIGTQIARRWMSERVTGYFLATILVFAGTRLLLR